MKLPSSQSWLAFCLGVLLLSTSISLVLAQADPAFKSPSFTSATATDAEGLEREIGLPEQKLSFVGDDLDAESEGFGSFDGLLHWAIGHSDPETLKGKAQEAGNFTLSELEKRQSEIKELVEGLQMPSEIELMKIAITDLQNSSLPVEYRQQALQELLELVEPIDNAVDFSKLGGLTVVVKELDRAEEDLRIYAAWVLAKASQNNGVLQDQLLGLGVLPRLVQMVRSNCAEEAVKAFFALSSLIQNHYPGQKAFYLQGGVLLLEDLIKNKSFDVRLRKKSLSLIADLADQQMESGGVLISLWPAKSFIISVVNLIGSPDLDIQEKALMAIHSLGRSSSTAWKILRNDCELVAALDKLLLQVDDLIRSEDQADFARDIQVLCQTIKSMLQEEQEGAAFRN